MKNRVLPVLLPALAGAALSLSAVPAADHDPVIFVSSFAGGEEGAIHAYRLSTETGALEPLHSTGGIANPFFLALSPDRRFLYAVHAEAFGGETHEEVAAFAVEGRSGRLAPLNRQGAQGAATCYLAVDATGKALLLANYSTGSVAALPLGEDGTLGPAASFVQHEGGSGVDPKRQNGSYAHSIIVSPDNRHAYAADLGLDQVLGYSLDADAATLEPLAPPSAPVPPGGGPRHLAFSPDGRFLYAINELSNTITRFRYDRESGALAPEDTVPTLPPDFEGTSHTADLKFTPDGRFLYGTNRGHDSIACYRAEEDGSLSLLAIVPSRGQGPQNLAITPDGQWLLCANMPGDNLAVFRIDPASGALAPAGDPVEVRRPACLQILPSP